MNELTVVGPGGVLRPDILTEAEAQALLDRYGVGGTAITIPAGTNLQKYLGRVDGGFYYDDATTSGTTGGPIADKVHYTVLSADIPGNRTILAVTKGNHLYTAEVYGDVFQGWASYGNSVDVKSWIDAAIEAHEQTRDHPYATETDQGFIEIASPTEAVSGTDNTRALTSLRAQNLLSTYGLGATSVKVPNNSDLAVYFNTVKPGFYHLDASTGYGYQNTPTDVAFAWAEIIVGAHEATNYRTLLMITAEGRLYTAVVSAGSFSGWRRKIEFADIPHASATVDGLTKVLDSISSSDQVNAGSANAVRVAYETANSKVPQTRRINGLALTGDINITPGLIGTYTAQEIDAKLAGLGTLQDIRWGGLQGYGNSSFVGWEKGRKTVTPAGGVMVDIADYSTSKIWIEDVDNVWWRYLQKQVGGSWYNVGAI